MFVGRTESTVAVSASVLAVVDAADLKHWYLQGRCDPLVSQQSCSAAHGIALTGSNRADVVHSEGRPVGATWRLCSKALAPYTQVIDAF